MVYEIKATEKVKVLFDGWEETMIRSCLQNVMGKIYVTDLEIPKSAFAYVGCFGVFVGEPDRELVMNKPDGFVILTPQDEAWAKLIEECVPSAKRTVRYAIKKDTKFDVEALKGEIRKLPAGYEIRQIDSALYDQCLKSPVTVDFVSSFENKEQFLKMGRGMVIMKDEEIVSGASSFARYQEGIEIEVDTVEAERRKHLATIACSALILKCLEEGLYPSWDAQNMNSVRLAEKLGYEFDHEYVVYEFMGSDPIKG
ncbi:MAG: GNAT family N-acetyltransferase [Fusicatenibacter sp.]|nr:GNAT family N-acetyltransferase [Lachnospiraceae bacterium]MDY2936748.1 GNAT family N-acetyltransferase [Fusicatenibacter sp.]